MAKSRRKGPKQPRVVCAAKRKDGTACDATVSNANGQDPLEAKWCRKHHEEFIAIDKEYQSFGKDLLGDGYEWYNVRERWKVEDIEACMSGQDLSSWYDNMHDIYYHMHPCYERYLHLAACYFHDDPAFGENTLNKTLTERFADLQRIMSLTAERARSRVLEEADASWLIDTSCSGVCNHPQRADFPSPYPPRNDTQVAAFFKEADITKGQEERDPINRTRERRVQELLAETVLEIAARCSPPHSDYFDERLDVIYTAVTRAVCQDPDLFSRFQWFECMSNCLVWEGTHDEETKEKMLRIVEHALKDAHLVRRAVEDTLLAEDPDQEAEEEPQRFVFAGVEMRKARDSRDLPFSAWGHILAISQCVPCVMETVTSVSELQTLYRFLDIYKIPTDWSIGNTETVSLALSGERQIDQALFCCGSIVNFVEAKRPRQIIEEVVDGEETVWQETQNAILLCGTISTSEPLAVRFLAVCARFPDFKLLLRGKPAPPDAWWTRTRRAKHKRDLVHQTEWEIGEVVPMSLLDKSNPLRDRPGLRGKSMDFVICDITSCDLTQVKCKLAEIWVTLHGVSTVAGIRRKVIEEYMEVGEAEEELDDEETKTPALVHFLHRPTIFFETFMLMMQLSDRPFLAETTDSSEMRFVNAAFRRFQ
ncbi:hypothetical protein VNI00_010384 [Paramarasmius palmivorus]|uniref:Uncharacterized protein n=1 Tax=Paramarasmius palmivorus TaxID=297713 RepID=A0AAW0CGB6_9AGAR